VVRRDRHDIAIDILTKASSGKKKTELMTEVGLSYLQTKQYLKTLMERGLLEADAKKNYKTSRKGAEFLEKCNECILFPWERQRKKQL
jgi:predicted transcriptional regulator